MSLRKRLEIGRLDTHGHLLLWVADYLGGHRLTGVRVIGRLWPWPKLSWSAARLAWQEWRNGIW